MSFLDEAAELLEDPFKMGAKHEHDYIATFGHGGSMFTLFIHGGHRPLPLKLVQMAHEIIRVPAGYGPSAFLIKNRWGPLKQVSSMSDAMKIVDELSRENMASSAAHMTQSATDVLDVLREEKARKHVEQKMLNRPAKKANKPGWLEKCDNYLKSVFS